MLNPSRITPCAVLCTLLALPGLVAEARAQPRGIAGREAPPWRVDRWFNLPEGRESIDVDDFKGKVVYLYGFQSWCPGCHSHGFPTLQELIRRFDEAEDVAFVAVQTTFEGFHTNTPAKARDTARRYDLDIPVGHSGANGRRSRLMRDYRTGGTPWTILIDRQGVVRFNDFHITPDRAEQLINTLRKEPGPEDETAGEDQGGDAAGSDVEIETLPERRGGQDLIGTRFPDIEFDEWVRDDRRDASPEPAEVNDGASDRDHTAKGKPKATLYRWWTDTCPYCEASLPGFERLRDKYESKGLRVVAVYHPKPPRPIDGETVESAADHWGFHGPIAVDQEWSALRTLYLDTGRRRATSAAFLVDADGVIRFVHPGPVLFPSDDPDDAQANRDFELLEQAVEAVLNQTPDP